MAERKTALRIAILSLMGLLGACQSTLFPDPAVRHGEPSTWPGGDQAAYETMTAQTYCRSTLGAPDCVTVSPVARASASAPAPADPAALPPAAGGPILLTPRP